jgi:hypothetical protein
MKAFLHSPWGRRLLFFLAGLLFATLCLVVSFHWMSIVPYGSFDEQPAWLKGLSHLVAWLPWIAFAIVLVLRFAKGPIIHVVFYFLGAVTPIAVIIGWLFLGTACANLVHRQKFDPELWRKQDTIEHDAFWPPRLCMVDDLISSRALDDLTEHEVVQLLGPPHDKSFPFGSTRCDIHYYLGPERGFYRIDSEWLFITFGHDGKVNRYWLYRD